MYYELRNMLLTGYLLYKLFSRRRQPVKCIFPRVLLCTVYHCVAVIVNSSCHRALIDSVMLN